MPLEDINCPQFVDFTTRAAFDIHDGADFCFEKRVVGEETDLGFFGSGSSDDKLMNQLNEISTNLQGLSVLGPSNKTQENDSNKRIFGHSDQNQTKNEQVPASSVKKTEKENKENISGASKVGSALDMIYSKSAKSTAPSPAIAHSHSHNPPVIKGEQQAKTKTPVLSGPNTTKEHHHARTLSTSAAVQKPPAEKATSAISMYKGIRFLPKQATTPSKKAVHATAQEHLPSKPMFSSNIKLDEIIKNRPESLNANHAPPRIVNTSVLANKQPAERKTAPVISGLTRATPGKSASFKQQPDSAKQQRPNLIATLKSSFMRSRQTPATPGSEASASSSNTSRITSYKSDRDLSQLDRTGGVDEKTPSNGSKLMSGLNHLRKKSATSGGGFLHTEMRALKRGEFDQQLKEKEKVAYQMRRELEAERLRRQQEETQRLRTKSNFKVQPIKQYKPIEIRPSEKPLTDPKSPNLTLNASHANTTAAKFNSSTSHSQYH